MWSYFARGGKRWIDFSSGWDVPWPPWRVRFGGYPKLIVEFGPYMLRVHW